MVWQWIGTVLAAWGLLCALWAGFGWLLPGSKKVTLALMCREPEASAAVLRLRWLNRLGLLRCRLILPGIPAEQLPRQYEEIEFCTLAEFSAGIEAERERFD